MEDLKKEFIKAWAADKQEQFREPEYCQIDPELIFKWFSDNLKINNHN